MPDGFKITLEGARELEAALGEFAKGTERGIMRRVAIKALEPTIERARELVPVHEGNLRDSLTVGTKLTKRARAAAKRDPVEGVRVFAGTANRNGVPREFGTARTKPEPFMRPAWDSTRFQVLDNVMTGLSVEIEKSRKRAERKAMKAKG